MNATDPNTPLDRPDGQGGGEFPKIPKGLRVPLIDLVKVLGVACVVVFFAYLLATNESSKRADRAERSAIEANKRAAELETFVKTEIKKIDESTRLMGVSGTIDEPHKNEVLDREEVSCSGQVRYLPDNFRLWIAVEVDDGYFFKGGEMLIHRRPDDAMAGWSAKIHQPASQDVFNLTLYAATPSGDYLIRDYLRRGKARGNRFDRLLVDFPGTYRIADSDNHRIQPKR